MMNGTVKKIIAVFLVGAFVASAVAGCGVDSDKSENISSETVTEMVGSDEQTDEQTSAANNSEYAAWGLIQTSGGGNANIRTTPSGDSDIIGSAKNDSLIRIYDRSSNKNWYKVSVDDQYGYISAKIVTVKMYAITVYKGDQTVVISKNGDLSDYRVFRCSTGRDGNETPARDYYVTTTLKGRKKDYAWRELKGGDFCQYGTSVSPNYLLRSLPYKTKRKNSTMDKSSYEALLQGLAQSDGGIALCARDAKWIFENCDRYTPVRVVDEKSNKQPTEDYPVLKKGHNSNDVSYSGWDPTDPDKNNPYNVG